LEYNGRTKGIRTFLTAVNSYLTLEKVSPFWEEMFSALDPMEEADLDYVDPLTLRVMERKGVKEICSNNKDFDRTPWLKRV
ncbi:MAG: hypothetical protein DRO11_07540, partial [Methanobacteriota archaeon]